MAWQFFLNYLKKPWKPLDGVLGVDELERMMGKGRPCLHPDGCGVTGLGSLCSNCLEFLGKKED